MNRPPQRPAAHEIERYAGLFAARTRQMKSSAMRDLMALTEREEVISLAGGLPDTSTFPAESFASIMAKVAVDSCAAALQYGPTEGLALAKDAIRHVMAAEGNDVDPEDILVTTGGQQVIDLVCKTLIDPGDVVVAEAPTYPGAIPTFCAYEADVVQIEMDADGMPIDVLEETLDRLEAEGRRPKFIYTIPNFQNPGGVTMSLPRRKTTPMGSSGTRARRSQRCSSSAAATSSSTSARSPRSCRRGCGSAGPWRPRPCCRR
jgi:2-aminoadipate transaminase